MRIVDSMQHDFRDVQKRGGTRTHRAISFFYEIMIVRCHYEITDVQFHDKSLYYMARDLCD